MLGRLAAERFDVLVIGGGITGAGAALDAASRGLRVALVESRDLASGTSSRSSKLIHGGLRYLEQFDFKLVYEALRERDLVVSRLAPHLVKPVSFLYPLYKKVVERPYVGAGLVLYDAMEGTRRPVPHHRHLTARGALKRAPVLSPGDDEQHAFLGAQDHPGVRVHRRPGQHEVHALGHPDPVAGPYPGQLVHQVGPHPGADHHGVRGHVELAPGFLVADPGAGHLPPVRGAQ